MLTALFIVIVAVIWMVPFVWNWRRIARVMSENDLQLLRAAMSSQGNSEKGLLELIATYPKSPIPMSRWAERKLDEKAWSEALQRGEKLTSAFPKDISGYLICVKALIGLKEAVKAEVLIDDVLRRFPLQSQPLIDHATMSHMKQDWPEAQRRWALVRHKFPSLAKGYVWEAKAYVQLDNPAKADELLHEAVSILKETASNEALIAYADLAHQRGRWTEAVERWRIIREKLDTNPLAYWRGSEALRCAGFIDEAGSLMETAKLLFPTNEQILAELKQLSLERSKIKTSV